jgi:transcriptional regulator with XRE-family HTH domain
MPRPKNAAPNQRIRFTHNNRETILPFAALGNLLRMARKKKGHSAEQTVLAISINQAINRSTLSRLETGEQMPTFAVAQKILQYVYGNVYLYPDEPTDYNPSSQQQLFGNFLEHCPELDPEDRQLLVNLYEKLSEARGYIRKYKGAG